MKVLAIDTSGNSSGVALIVDGEVAAASEVQGARNHSTQLFAQIDTVLEAAKVGRDELEGVAVTVGPGSFTGLRVGIATAKGIAAGLGVKVAGVSTLAALAHTACPTGCDVVVPMLDARKGQVYASAANCDDCGAGGLLIEEGAWNPEELAPKLKGLGRKCLLIGSGIEPFEEIFKEALGEHYDATEPELWNIDPAAVAVIGYSMLECGEGVEAEVVAPVYHRMSEAEVSRKEREGLKG